MACVCVGEMVKGGQGWSRAIKGGQGRLRAVKGDTSNGVTE